MITLMIVDDEPASRNVIKAFLKSDSFDISQILEAENGLAAMDMFHSGSLPQIVISDMEMPLADGIQFLDFLRDCHPQVKVIVVSGYFDFHYTHAAIKAGAQDYLLKPIDPGALCHAVSACIESIQQEQKQKLVSISQTKLDISTYKEILKESEHMRVLLSSGNFDYVHKSLDALHHLIQASPCREAARLFAIQSFTHILYYYCITHDYTFIQPKDISIQGHDMQISQLTHLYEKTLCEIRNNKKATGMDEIAEKIKYYIDSCYRLPLHLEDIASSFYVNKEYISTVFHKKWGYTISSYILKLKMEESVHLLQAEDDIPISSIAQMVGYDDPAYFSRVFKKYTGYSPAQYKRLKKQP